MYSESCVLFIFVKTVYLKLLQPLAFVILVLGTFSCTHTDLYEKTAVIPGHSWKSTFKPSFSFTIKDTSSPYMVTDETGWLGSGMDDIYEHREPITPRSSEKAFYFRKPGDYTFTIEQLMRQDPLENVLNAGIRIEKK